MMDHVSDVSHLKSIVKTRRLARSQNVFITKLSAMTVPAFTVNLISTLIQSKPTVFIKHALLMKLLTLVEIV